MKKVLSILLSIVMMTSVLCGISFTATATTNGYTRTSAANYIENTICGTGWNIDGGGNGFDCVDLVYKYFRDLGNYYTIQYGNAYIYANSATLPSGWTRQYRSNGYTPQKGDIACWGTEYSSTGHVALVYAVDSNNIYVVEQKSSLNVAAFKSTYAISSPKCFIVPDFPSEEPVGHGMTESEAAGQTIPDGDYYIVSGINQNYFVDIPGNDFNTPNTANVQIWSGGADGMPGIYDCFTFHYENNGFYSIKQMTTNMSLEVSHASLTSGANVQMMPYVGNDAQLWSVVRTGIGYKIQNKQNSFYLDVAGAVAADGTNIQIWDGNESTGQYFGLVPYTPNERPVADGVYTIKTKVNTSYFLDVAGIPGTYVDGTNIQLWESDAYDNDERYLIKYVSDGWYCIYEETSKLPLGINNPGTTYIRNGNNIQLCSSNGSKGQFWKIRKTDDGSYYLINKVSGYYMSLEMGATTDGNNVSQFNYTGKNYQRWVLVMDKKPAKPAVSVASKDKTVTVSWSKCAEVNKYDNRTYSVSVYQKSDNGATKQVASKTGITDTKYTFNAPDYGNYFVKVTAVNTNYDGYKTASDETVFTVKKFVKKANPIFAKGKTKTVKYANVKKKNVTIARKDVISVSKAQGKVTYTKASGNKKITVSGAGKITVKKGLKKGTYKVKVKVKAAGNATYKAKTVTVTVTVKVK